jgi:hypothetical protein
MVVTKKKRKSRCCSAANATFLSATVGISEFVVSAGLIVQVLPDANSTHSCAHPYCKLIFDSNEYPFPAQLMSADSLGTLKT